MILCIKVKKLWVNEVFRKNEVKSNIEYSGIIWKMQVHCLFALTAISALFVGRFEKFKVFYTNLNVRNKNLKEFLKNVEN